MFESIPIKTADQIEHIRKSALLVSSTLGQIAQMLKPGISTLEIDIFAEQFIRSHQGATPSFKNYKGFPFSTCISVNEEVVHGFPRKDKILAENDVISVDVGVYLNGFHGDSAFTFLLGNAMGMPDEQTTKLLRITRESLYKAIEVCRNGCRIGDIGFAVQSHCESHQLGVVRELTGHGIGRNLHEPPNIPNYGKRSQGSKLAQGMVIAVEPMITLGTHHVRVEADDWTITTKDGKLAAHYEHTIAVSASGSGDILSDFEIIDKAVLANRNLFSVV